MPDRKDELNKHIRKELPLFAEYEDWKNKIKAHTPSSKEIHEHIRKELPLFAEYEDWKNKIVEHASDTQPIKHQADLLKEKNKPFSEQTNYFIDLKNTVENGKDIFSSLFSNELKHTFDNIRERVNKLYTGESKYNSLDEKAKEFYNNKSNQHIK
jgi:hypothetical protein